jgi:hypothetical protein
MLNRWPRTTGCRTLEDCGAGCIGFTWCSRQGLLTSRYLDECRRVCGWRRTARLEQAIALTD